MQFRPKVLFVGASAEFPNITDWASGIAYFRKELPISGTS